MAGGTPLIEFEGHGRGHRIVAGMELYRLAIGADNIRFVRVYDQLRGHVKRPAEDFCVVPAEHYRRFYRFLREKVRRDRGTDELAPVMTDEGKKRLWENTVGFLAHGRQRLKLYGVPQKPGVLLIGAPGNGKTMACRWLRNECYKLGLEWRYIRTECYERTRVDGDLQSLFDLDEPGVILFDDFDLGVRNREEFGATAHHSTFLGELDGVDTHDGVVFIFTMQRPAGGPRSGVSAARADRLRRRVSAARRPGWRRRVIVEHWHADIHRAGRGVCGGGDRRSELCRTGGDQEAAGAAFLAAGQWDWNWAWNTFRTDARQAKPARPVIGLVRAAPANHNSLAEPVLNETSALAETSALTAGVM